MIASASSTAVGTSPATTPETKAPSAAAALVPATTAPTPSAPAVAAADCDGDGQPDTVDVDDDNDLLPDTTEAAIGTNPCNADSDGDGMQDGWEYQSAIDLNTGSCPQPSGRYPVPCAAAMPTLSKHRAYPNPLDGTDGGTDYDGDWMTAGEEYQGWLHKATSDPTYRALTGTKGMWYSAGKQSSVDTAVSATCIGMAVPDPFNGNMVAHSSAGPTAATRTSTRPTARRSSPSTRCTRSTGGTGTGASTTASATRTATSSRTSRRRTASCPAPASGRPRRASRSSSRATTARDWLDPDSDGDGDNTVDGLDDQDFDDFLNVEELVSRNADVADKDNKYTGAVTGLWVDPFNPCLPYIESRTCPTAMPLGNPGAWRPFFADMSKPEGPRWPLYRNPLYQIDEQDPNWVDPTPTDTTDNAAPILHRPGGGLECARRRRAVAAAGAPAPAHRLVAAATAAPLPGRDREVPPRTRSGGRIRVSRA